MFVSPTASKPDVQSPSITSSRYETLHHQATNTRHKIKGSPPNSTDIKSTWSNTVTPPYFLTACYLLTKLGNKVVID
jgi:hypothetical protein